MRIVEYNGIPVKRQKKTASGKIKVTFYDARYKIVTPQEWARNHRDRYFDDPSIRRCDVVRAGVLN